MIRSKDINAVNLIDTAKLPSKTVLLIFTNLLGVYEMLIYLDLPRKCMGKFWMIKHFENGQRDKCS